VWNEADFSISWGEKKNAGQQDFPVRPALTMNPENRMLKQISIENAAEVDYIFSMLMGEDVG